MNNCIIRFWSIYCKIKLFIQSKYLDLNVWNKALYFFRLFTSAVWWVILTLANCIINSWIFKLCIVTLQYKKIVSKIWAHQIKIIFDAVIIYLENSFFIFAISEIFLSTPFKWHTKRFFFYTYISVIYWHL